MAFVDVREALDDQAQLEAGYRGDDDLERELGLVEPLVAQSLAEVALEDGAESRMHLGQARLQ